MIKVSIINHSRLTHRYSILRGVQSWMKKRYLILEMDSGIGVKGGEGNTVSSKMTLWDM
jgi:hypothetical protein